MRTVLSCSEGNSRANTNRSVAEGIEETRQVVEMLRSAGDVHITGALATVFVCPFDGIVPVEQVAYVVGALFLCGGIANVVMLPAPLWFEVLDLVTAYLPMAWLGARLATRPRAVPVAA